MTICDDSVETNLVEVRGLKLEHLVDTSTVDGISCVCHLLGRTIGTAEASRDELLSILVKQVESIEVGTCRNLDQLRETVADLSLRESAEEGEVKEGANRGVVSTKTVLVVAVVNSDLDGHRSIDQTNHSSGDTDEVGVTAVRCTGESVRMLVLFG